MTDDNQPVHINPVAGIRLGAVASGIRYQNRLDLVVVELCEESFVAGVTTKNAFCAAPVQILKRHLASKPIKYFLINTGNANAGTGESGIVDSLTCCSALAELVDVDERSVLPFSTGVIGEKLPVETLTKSLPDVLGQLGPENWLEAATGILTTDTKPKLASRTVNIDGRKVTITGFAKGAGMIKPNMATMLAYVFTDAEIGKSDLDALLKSCVDGSFNRITVDGDTSTNDCCMLVATGKSGAKVNKNGIGFEQFQDSLFAVFKKLATGLIRDAEGATKFVTVHVCGGATKEECLQVAYCVAESPLVKTAMFAADPNWGRILAAVGRAGITDFDINLVKIYLSDTCIVSGGAVHGSYTEYAGQQEMDKPEIVIRIELGRGRVNETVWTSDLSNEYVRINADYRS